MEVELKETAPAHRFCSVRLLSASLPGCHLGLPFSNRFLTSPINGASDGLCRSMRVQATRRSPVLHCRINLIRKKEPESETLLATSCSERHWQQRWHAAEEGEGAEEFYSYRSTARRPNPSSCPSS